MSDEKDVGPHVSDNYGVQITSSIGGRGRRHRQNRHDYIIIVPRTDREKCPVVTSTQGSSVYLFLLLTIIPPHPVVAVIRFGHPPLARCSSCSLRFSWQPLPSYVSGYRRSGLRSWQPTNPPMPASSASSLLLVRPTSLYLPSPSPPSTRRSHHLCPVSHGTQKQATPSAKAAHQPAWRSSS